jgi:8-oxo-dGTP pyrophosphatase MutT (NUDIX family)
MKQFAGTLVIKDGQILLVQESHTSAKGLWSLPIGSVEENETLAEGAIRETKEETGYDVKLGKAITLSMTGEELKSARRFHQEQVTLTIFEAEVVSGNLLPGEDLLDAKWHPIKELSNLELRGDWVKNYVNNKF